ncbi:signal peptidase I [Protaetiibacter larvae]|uniref:Signal peptidase I n=1 Tax=Protaetiibacter larvae TaxID=2592654 RepID=A0A5C1YAT3_9MICO|nr:signal peptidase I [Protaetiibacter larvae]QEO10528.1 signal peptidase I [Protaetiibacter larvae]
MEPLPTRREARAAETGGSPRAAKAPKETAQRGPVASVFRAIGVGLSAGLLLFMLGLAVIVVIVPIATGSSTFTVLTGSMQPHLPPGTFIVVRPTPAEDIRIGDVITYQLESGKPAVVTHRVIARTIDGATGELTFTTQGDANNTPDPKPVTAVQVRGVLWYAVPYIGWVNNVLNGESRAWLVPLLAGVLFAYAAWMFAAGVRDRRRTKRAAAAPPASPPGDDPA